MKVGDAILPLHDCLTVEDGRSAFQLRCSGDQVGISLRPVVSFHREGASGAVLDDKLGSIAIMLDLVQPLIAFRRSCRQGRPKEWNEGKRLRGRAARFTRYRGMRPI